MSITAEQKFLLNRYMGPVAAKVQLGTLLDEAGNVSAGEITLANGSILIGNGSGVAAANAMSGAITITNTGVTSIASGAVTLAKLAAGVTYSHRVFAAGEFTTAGGDTSETIVVAGALATDLAFVNSKSGNALVSYAAAAAGQINVTMSADPGNDDVLTYMLLRAAS